jgi:hypothetical protein
MNSSVSSRAPNPQLARTTSSTERWTASGPMCAPLAKVPYSISAATRSGWRTAKLTATGPAYEEANSDSGCWGSCAITVSRSSTSSSSEKSTRSRREKPQPWRSNQTTV